MFFVFIWAFDSQKRACLQPFCIVCLFTWLNNANIFIIIININDIIPTLWGVYCVCLFELYFSYFFVCLWDGLLALYLFSVFIYFFIYLAIDLFVCLDSWKNSHVTKADELEAKQREIESKGISLLFVFTIKKKVIFICYLVNLDWY